MTDTPNPLELVSTDSMIKELQRRHDDFVLLAAQHRTNTFDGIMVCFGGSLHGVFGLLSIAKITLSNGAGGTDENEEEDAAD